MRARPPRGREELAALGYLAGWRVLGLLPEAPVLRAGYAIADRMAARDGGPAQLRRNLARVTGRAPEAVPDRLVRASLRSYLRYWVEAFRLPRMASPDLAARIGAGVAGAGHFDASHARGRGVVLVTTHSGNWDMAGTWLIDRVGGFTTVAERLRPEALYDAFVDFRESLGMRVLPLTGGEPPISGLRETLAGGGVVCLLGDRDLAGDGVPVEFFGEAATIPAGAAALARETGAALHVVDLFFDGPGRWGIRIRPEIAVAGRPVAEIVAEQAAQMQEAIAAHPEDWHLLQPFWPADRRGGR